MSRGRQPSTAVVLAVVGALVGVGLLVDTLVEPVGLPLAATEEVPLLAGSSTCAAFTLDDAARVTATAVALPPAVAGGAAADDGPTGDARLRLATDGDVRDLGELAVDGRTTVVGVPTDGALGGLTARWEQTPLLLSRRWSVDDTQRVPGAVEGPCPGEPGAEWIVPGVATAGGAAATLHLANPTEGPASVAITFTTPDGPVAPTRLANLAVEADGQLAVDLNQFVPEEPDLGVVVRARAGRVVAEVVQTLEAAVGGVDGRTLVAAQPAPAEVWTIPWVRAGDTDTAWVWVTNPGEEATDVRLVLHTASGPVVPADAGVTLAPGTTERIDLRGALATVGAAAVTVRSAPGVPIVASGAVVRAVPEDAVRSGVTVVEALVAGDGPQAALSSVGGQGRERVLVVANPGEEAAIVDVRVVGRSTATARTLVAGLAVAAGAVVEVPLTDELPRESAWAVVLEPREGVVAAAVVGSAASGPLDLLSMAARPFPSTVVVPVTTAVRDRSLLHPLLPAAPDPTAPTDEALTDEASTDEAP